MKFKLVSKKFAAVALAATLALGSFAVSAAQFDGQFAADANQSNQSAQSDQSNQSNQSEQKVAKHVAIKKATFKKNGLKGHYELDGKYYADKAATKEVTKKSLVIPKAAVKVSGSLTFTNKNVKASAVKKLVTVKRTGGAKIPTKVYTVKVAKTKCAGYHTATVSFKGAKNYTGSVKITYKVRPAKVTKVKATALAKHAVKVTWKKAAKAAKVSGYQVRYATTKKGLAKAKFKNVKATKSSYTIKKIKKSAKKVYVQVRSYKKNAGKTTVSKAVTTKAIKLKK